MHCQADLSRLNVSRARPRYEARSLTGARPSSSEEWAVRYLKRSTGILALQGMQSLLERGVIFFQGLSDPAHLVPEVLCNTDATDCS